MTLSLSNNARGGADGIDVTIANSAGGGDAFTTVDIDEKSTLQYSTELGVPAFKATTIGGGGLSIGRSAVTWTFPDTNRITGRMELYLPSPGPIESDWTGGSGGDGTIWTYLSITGSTLVHLWTPDRQYDTDTGTMVATPTSLRIDVNDAHLTAPNGTLPLDRWFRFEFNILTTDPGSYEIKLFPNVWTTEATHTWSGALTGAETTANRIAFGPSDWALIAPDDDAASYYFSNIVCDDSGVLPGPSSDGWVDIPGAIHSPLLFTATADKDQRKYRAVYTSARGSVNSAPAILTVVPAVPPDEGGDFPDDSLSDAWAPAEGPGSDTVLNLLRRFSAAVRRPVRLTGPNSAEMVNINAPLPTGMSQDDADAMYHSTSHTAQAGEKTLSLEEADLALTATAELATDDIRLITSDWLLPEQLPVWGLRPAPVSRVSYTFTPASFNGSLDFVYPVPLAVVRRA